MSSDRSLSSSTTEDRRRRILDDAGPTLFRLAATSSVQGILIATLDLAEEMTGSRIGFFHFIEDDQKSIWLQAWSTNTVANMCTAEGAGAHYPIDQAGIWADCVRRGRPTVHNDYASVAGKKGLPAGHAPIHRELVVPVSRAGRVAAVLGVGNKSTDYTEADVDSVSTLADLAWDIASRKRSEEALRASEDRLRRYFESAQEMIVLHELITDAAGSPVDYRIIDCNQRFTAITGISRDQAAGALASELYRLPRAPYLDVYAAVARSGESQVFETYFAPMGKHFRVSAFSTGPGRFATSSHDITDAKNAEEALRESEERFRALIEQSSDVTMVLDEAGKYSFVSPAFQALVGLAPSEVIGRSAFEFTHPDDVAAAREALAAAIQNPGSTQRARVRVRRADGAWAILSAKLNNMLAIPAVHGIVVHNRDVTERAAAEQVIRDREARLRAYFETPAVGVAIISPTMGWIDVNEFTCSMLGYSRDELFQKTWLELTHPDDMAVSVALSQRVIAGEIDRYSLDKRYLRKDGSAVWTLLSISCVRKADRSVDYFVAILKEITDRKQAEQALRVSEDRLALAVRGGQLGLWDWDLQSGRCTYSERWASMLGYTLDEIEPSASVWEKLLHPDDKARIQPILEANLRGEASSWAWEQRLRHKDGHWVWILGSGAVVERAPDGTPLRAAGTHTDISDRKAAEEALRESEGRFRTLTNAAPVGVFQADPHGNNVFMNPAMERIMGMSAKEARGKGWMESVHPEDRERVFQDWMAAIAEGRDFVSEYRFLTPTGRITWVRGYGSAIQDPAGANTGYMAVVVDITEQRAMEQRLAVASRLAAMGTLVTGVAHEINNPLTGIVAGLGSAAHELQDGLEKMQRGERPSPEVLVERDKDVLEALGDASEAAARITRIVKDLSIFGAPNQERTRQRIADVVSGALRWLPSKVHDFATVSVEDLGAPDVKASRGQLEQVLVNLVTNAARATRPGTKGSIQIRVGPGSPGMARLEVVDHGTGIEPANLGKIFDPFFTTRPAGEGRGTGLGLAICHAIVSDHGGTITVESEVGKGSTFRVELPAAPA